MGAGVVGGAKVDVWFASIVGASVVLFAASATHRRKRMCRGAMLASRARHAAAALLPRMPAE